MASAPQPPAPVRGFSFTDWQVAHPTEPPPGDRLDGEFDRTNNAVDGVLDWVATSLNTDGSLRAGTVGQSQLVSGLFDDVAQGIMDDVQPLVDEAQAYANSALASAGAADVSEANAEAANVAAQNAQTVAQGAAASADLAKLDAQASAATAGVQATDAANSANHAAGDAALAEDWGLVAQAWAEHMPDNIPPNILAVMGISGSHWSARWWADQAQIAAGGGAWLPLTGGTMTGPLILSADPITLPLQAATKSYVDTTVTNRLVGYLPLTGGQMTGTLRLAGNASGPLDAVPLQQLQGLDSLYVKLSGGTMSGPLYLYADPSGPMGAATKQYVDTKVGSAPPMTVSDTAPPISQGAMWFDSISTSLFVGYIDPSGAPGQWVVANNFTAAAGAYLPLTGGNVTGPTTFSGQLDALTLPYGDASTKAATTAFVQAAMAPVGNNTGRNLIHNALFNIQQRGQGPFSVNGVCTLDRWKLGVAGDTTSVQSANLDDGNRASIGDEAAVYALFVNIRGTAGAGSYTQVGQSIENVRRLAGKTVTVSFWAASGTGASVGVRLWQDLGTGGSPSAGVNTAPQTITTTSTPTRYIRTFTVPSVSGKTLGTNNDHRTELIFGLSASASLSSTLGVGVQTGDVWFWGVQLEIGTQATPLAKRDPADELALCQRFFETSYNGTPGAFALNSGEAFGMAHPATSFRAFVPFKVKKRASPTITVYDGAGTSNACAYYTNTWLNGGALFLQTGSQSGIYVGGGIANAVETQFGWTASADL